MPLATEKDIEFGRIRRRKLKTLEKYVNSRNRLWPLPEPLRELNLSDKVNELIENEIKRIEKLSMSVKDIIRAMLMLDPRLHDLKKLQI